MWRILTATIVSLLCVACSDGISTYEEGIEAQTTLMTEMVNILQRVTDQRSADEATAKIEALGEQLAVVTAQMEKFPEPTVSEMQQIDARQREQREELQDNALAQMKKLDQYDSLHKAWTRALAEMR